MELENRSRVLTRSVMTRATPFSALAKPLDNDQYSAEGVAVGKRRQVFAQYIYSERSRQEHCARPEAPVTMHAPPVRARSRFVALAAVSFVVVLASRHLFSISPEYSLRRAAWLQRAR